MYKSPKFDYYIEIFLVNKQSLCYTDYQIVIFDYHQQVIILINNCVILKSGTSIISETHWR